MTAVVTTQMLYLRCNSLGYPVSFVLVLLVAIWGHESIADTTTAVLHDEDMTDTHITKIDVHTAV